MCTLTMACLHVDCPLFAPGTETFRQITPSSGANSNFFLCSGETEVLGLLCFADEMFLDGPVVCLQAKRAVQRGATAVIFDVSENPDAIDQVCAPKNGSHVPATFFFLHLLPFKESRAALPF